MARLYILDDGADPKEATRKALKLATIITALEEYLEAEYGAEEAKRVVKRLEHHIRKTNAEWRKAHGKGEI